MAPKKLAAARKMSFVRANSRFSLRTAASWTRRSSIDPASRAALTGPGAASFTQLYNVTGLTFTPGASRSHAALRDSSGPISANTNRTH